MVADINETYILISEEIYHLEYNTMHAADSQAHFCGKQDDFHQTSEHYTPEDRLHSCHYKNLKCNGF
jgi:hypothetical protein